MGQVTHNMCYWDCEWEEQPSQQLEKECVMLVLLLYVGLLISHHFSRLNKRNQTPPGHLATINTLIIKIIIIITIIRNVNHIHWIHCVERLLLFETVHFLRLAHNNKIDINIHVIPLSTHFLVFHSVYACWLVLPPKFHLNRTFWLVRWIRIRRCI